MARHACSTRIHDGRFWGIRDGRVTFVEKWIEGRDVYFVDGDLSPDVRIATKGVLVWQGSLEVEAWNNFQLSHRIFVPESDCGTERENGVTAKLQAKLTP